MKKIRLSIDTMLEKRGITRYELAKRTGSHYPIITSYYKNKVVRYDSDLLLRICIALDCNIQDIIEIVDQPDQPKAPEV